MGTHVEIYDSDFHDLDHDKRMSGVAKTATVRIGLNVFEGSNVKILTRSTIGENSWIANGAFELSSVPENVIAAGNPARLIRCLMKGPR